MLKIVYYITGYYAIGPIVTYVAIGRPLSGFDEPNIVEIVTSDLRRIRNRIINIRRLLNLIRLIEPITKAIGWHEVPEFEPIIK